MVGGGDGGTRSLDGQFELFDRKGGRGDERGRLGRRRLDRGEQVVDAVDGGRVFNQAPLMQFGRQLADVRLGAVRDVTDDGEDPNRRQMQCRHAGQVDEVADRLSRQKLVDGGRLARGVLALDSAHVLDEELEGVDDDQFVRF